MELINDKDWGTSIGTVATSLVGAIIDAVNDIVTTPDLTRFVQNLGKGIINGMDALGDITGAIVGYILSPEGLTKIVQCGADFVFALSKGIALGMLNIGEGLMKMMGSIFTSALDSVMSWFGIETDYYWTKVSDMMFTNAEGATMKGSQLVTKYLGEQQGTLLEQVAAYLSLEKFDINGVLAQYESHFSEAGVALYQAVINGFQDGAEISNEQAMMVAGLIVAGMADGLQERYPELYEAGQAAVEQFEDAFGNGTDALIALCNSLGIEIPASLADALGDESIWNSASDALNTGMEQITGAVGDFMETAGKADMGRYGSGAEQGTEGAKNSVIASMNTTTDPENFTTAADNAQTTGENIGAGVSDGVSGKETDITTAVQGLVASMNTTHLSRRFRVSAIRRVWR